MKRAYVALIISILFFFNIAATVFGIEVCFENQYTCKYKAESICATTCIGECKCTCTNRCIELQQGACDSMCTPSKDCMPCYQVVNCKCSGVDINAQPFPFSACKQEHKCYNRLVCIQSNCKEESDLWLYDKCSGWLYEVQDCDQLAQTGSCGNWKCVAQGRIPTYKVKYRTDIEGYCYNSKCETRPVTNICEQFECAYGCAEVKGTGNCYPKAVISTVPGAQGYNVEISKGQSVVFDCSKSYDPDGAIITCKWDFGSNEGSATGTVVTHTFNREGSYSVKLTVTDSNGLTDSEELIVNVVYKDWPPVACFTVTPTEGIVGITEFSFDASCSSDPDIGLGDYITNYEWDFGDGYKANGVKVKHIYKTKPLKDETSYEVKLVVKDKGYGQQRNLAAMAKKKVIVKNTAPQASFSATPKEGKPPLEVKFKVLGSDPDGHFVSYKWDFGDGSSAIGKEVIHTYKEIGEYTVTLTATDEYGASSIEKTTIKVYNLRGITTISAENVTKGEATTIFADCTGDNAVDITIGKEAGSVTKLAAVRCGTHVDYGPIAEEGTYTVVAQIPDCNAPECIKTTSFNVIPQPSIKVTTSEVSPILLLIIALSVLGIVRWKNRRS